MIQTISNTIIAVALLWSLEATQASGNSDDYTGRLWRLDVCLDLGFKVPLHSPLCLSMGSLHIRSADTCLTVATAEAVNTQSRCCVLLCYL
jgi:hypothetical protein